MFEKPKYFVEEYETDNVSNEYNTDDDELERCLCKRLNLRNLPESGGSRILEEGCNHRQKHILRCIRSSMNLFYVRFCWEKSKKFSRREVGGVDPSHPLNPPLLPENPLEFWKNHKIEFPVLAKIARQIFSVTAASKFVERSFSAAENIVTKRRTNIKPMQLNNVPFLRSFYSFH
jgi:hypothetical protein